MKLKAVQNIVSLANYLLALNIKHVDLNTQLRLIVREGEKNFNLQCLCAGFVMDMNGN